MVKETVKSSLNEISLVSTTNNYYYTLHLSTETTHKLINGIKDVREPFDWILKWYEGSV